MLMSRKAVGLILCVIYLLGYAGPAFANPGAAVGAAAAAVFADVPAGHWAEKDIAKMRAKGIVSGVAPNMYGPNSPVTREQLVVMLSRAMGWADEAAGKTLPATINNHDRISTWARSFVAYAIERGVIAGVDLPNFRPADAARRHEAAVLIVRALGMEAEAARLAQGVRPPFTDIANIPAWALGHVALVRNLNIMSGNPDGTFRPLDPINRAQIAAVLARVDNQANRLAAMERRGEVFTVSPADRSILVTVSGGVTITVPVAADAAIFKAGRTVPLTGLARGDRVLIVSNAAGSAAFIDVMRPEDFRFDQVTLRGTIKSVNPTANPTFVLTRQEGGDVTISVATDTQIFSGTQARAISDLSAGLSVEAIVEGTRAVRINLLSGDQQVTGRLKSVALTAGVHSIVVTRPDNTDFTVRLAPNVSVLLDSRSAKAEDLFPGQSLEITVRGNNATLILASSVETDAEGTLAAVAFAPREAIRIVRKDGTEITFPVAPDVRVRRANTTITLRDLLPGDELEINLRNGVVQRIYASQLERRIQGRVQAVTIAATPRISLMERDGVERAYSIAPNARITRGTSVISLPSVQIGSDATVTVVGGLITEMNVELRTTQDYVIGVVENINTTARVLVLKEKDTNRLREIFLRSGADLIRFGSFINLNNVRITDEVIVVGKVESGVFMGSLVVIVGTAD
ncbi:MAG: S-layer homology domain-containing protein [Syntrophomonadaceae bacterium]|nr:S-layer homology domain-containing protein [Syntrophomonadaceae bacterium]